MSLPTSPTSDSTPKAPIPGDHSVVDVNWEKISYLWTIKHFQQFHCEVNENHLKSTVFSAAKHPEYKWRLIFYFKQSGHENDDYFGVFLRRCEPTTKPFDNVFVDVKFCILNGEHDIVVIKKFSKQLTSEVTGWGFPKFVSKTTLLDPSKRNEFLPDDTLRISCEMIMIFDPINRATNDGKESTTSNNSLSENADAYLLDNAHTADFVDVTFLVDGKTYRAERIILAARSPVFAAMFKQDIRENKHSNVNISDMSFETFKCFLIYLYTDIFLEDAEMARNLLMAADKYDVGGLKAVCEEILWTNLAQNLSAENVISVLTLADKFRAKQLKEQVASYIKKHPSIMTTQRWKCEILAHPHLFDLVNGVDKASASVRVRVPYTGRCWTIRVPRWLERVKKTLKST